VRRSGSVQPARRTLIAMLPHDLDPVGLFVAFAALLAYRRVRDR
jgi:hypothetical protein